MLGMRPRAPRTVRRRPNGGKLCGPAGLFQRGPHQRPLGRATLNPRTGLDAAVATVKATPPPSATTHYPVPPSPPASADGTSSLRPYRLRRYLFSGLRHVKTRGLAASPSGSSAPSALPSASPPTCAPSAALMTPPVARNRKPETC